MIAVNLLHENDKTMNYWL